MQYKRRPDYDAMHHREVFEDKTGLYVRWYGRVMRRMVDNDNLHRGSIVYIKARAGPRDLIPLYPADVTRQDFQLLKTENFKWDGETGQVCHKKKSTSGGVQDFVCGTDKDLVVKPIEEVVKEARAMGVPIGDASKDLDTVVKAVSEEKMQKAKELAGKHWAWLGPLLEKVYHDAFVHGYKHGLEEKI